MLCVGFTTTEFPRIAPTCGETIEYDAPFAVQLKVTGCPDITVCGFAVKLVICGEGPCGTFCGVYSGLMRTTSNADAGTIFNVPKSLLFQRLSGSPLMYMELPLSAMIIPYF